MNDLIVSDSFIASKIIYLDEYLPLEDEVYYRVAENEILSKF